MRTVLVDTAAWIALVNTRDELHERAKQAFTSDHHRASRFYQVTLKPDEADLHPANLENREILSNFPN